MLSIVATSLGTRSDSYKKSRQIRTRFGKKDFKDKILISIDRVREVLPGNPEACRPIGRTDRSNSALRHSASSF